MHPSPFHTPYKALVLGSSGAIGSAFIQALQADPLCLEAVGLSRSNGQFDLTQPESIQQAAQQLRASGPFHIMIDATGALTLDGHGPEKSLSQVQPDRLMQQFQINAIGPLLALQHFAPLLAHGPALYAKLSARVGSISDNQKGGWYGYRSAKAALNMFLQTAAIELQRKNPALQIAALQPGTVKSALSAPFSASVPQLLEPAESVAGLLAALRNLAPKAGAHFIDYKGDTIAW